MGCKRKANDMKRTKRAHRLDKPVPPRGRNAVGIDIGRKRHAASGVRPDGEKIGKTMLANDRQGVDRIEGLLLKPLGGPDGALVAMEATGHYWKPVCHELMRRGYETVVINPIQTRGAFRSRIRKAKTDKLDATSIAELVLSGKAHAARIPEECTLELRMLARHRWRLVDYVTSLAVFAHALIDQVFPEFAHAFSDPLCTTARAIINHIGLAPDDIAADRDALLAVVRSASRGALGQSKADLIIECAKRSIGIRVAERVMVDQLRSVFALMKTLEAQRDELDEQLAARVAQLNSPLTSLGLNAPVIATIHGESDPVTDFPHAWQYAAFTGLEPSTFSSGNYKKYTNTPISKRGSPYLRRAFYTAAMALYRKHTYLHRCYTRHKSKGRHHTDALVIVAHKLARITWRLLTDNRPYTARPPKRAPNGKNA
jgi:transposase